MLRVYIEAYGEFLGAGAFMPAVMIGALFGGVAEGIFGGCRTWRRCHNRHRALIVNRPLSGLRRKFAPNSTQLGQGIVASSEACGQDFGPSLK
jgi:hypothetical protein